MCALSSCPGKKLLRTDLQYHTDSLLEDANGKQPERKSYNPWGLHCHRQHLNRMSSKHNENKLQRILSPLSPPAQSWLQVTAGNRCRVYCRGMHPFLCAGSGKIRNILCYLLPLLKKKAHVPERVLSRSQGSPWHTFKNTTIQELAAASPFISLLHFITHQSCE